MICKDDDSNRGGFEIKFAGNRTPKRVLGPKTEKITGGWKELHNEEFHNSNSSSHIIRVIRSRRLRCAEHVARMG
jgi:hypothetical protein